MRVKLKSFFKYFGSKLSTIPKYPVPRYSTIIEPFAGSATYSVYYHTYNIHLYDKYPVVAGIWDYLIKVSEEEFLRLPTDIEDVRLLPICQEAKWLISYWIGNCPATPRYKPSTWKKAKESIGDFSIYWSDLVKSRIASQLQYIRHWKIFNKGYDYSPDIVATWFIDPPYQVQGVNYYKSDISYPFLSNWTDKRKGQVICCGQEGDNWREFVPFNISRAATRNGQRRDSKEVIWFN